MNLVSLSIHYPSETLFTAKWWFDCNEQEGVPGHVGALLEQLADVEHGPLGPPHWRPQLVCLQKTIKDWSKFLPRFSTPTYHPAYHGVQHPLLELDIIPLRLKVKNATMHCYIDMCQYWFQSGNDGSAGRSSPSLLLCAQHGCKLFLWTHCHVHVSTYPIVIVATVFMVMVTALLWWSVSFFMKGALRLLHHPPKLPVQEPTGKANILIKTSLGLQSKICRINIFKFSNQRACFAGQHRVPVVLESLVSQGYSHFLSNFTSSPEFIIVMCQHFFNHNFCKHTKMMSYLQASIRACRSFCDRLI